MVKIIYQWSSVSVLSPKADVCFLNTQTYLTESPSLVSCKVGATWVVFFNLSSLTESKS